MALLQVLRLTLHDSERRSAATLHVVDLVGTLPAASAAAGGGGVDLERRCLAQQVLSWTRLLAEVAQLDASAGTGGLKTARESKLTQLLAPLYA